MSAHLLLTGDGDGHGEDIASFSAEPKEGYDKATYEVAFADRDAKDELLPHLRIIHFFREGSLESNDIAFPVFKSVSEAGVCYFIDITHDLRFEIDMHGARFSGV